MRTTVALRLSTLIILSIVGGSAHTLAGAPLCARMYAKGHSEAVINTCDTCRRVAIQRRRVGASGAPVMRTYDLQPKSKFSLPFKGPGRSRVTSDVPCRGDLGGGSDLLNPGKGQRKNTQKQCVYLQGTKNNKVLLINRCSRCRAAAVARYSRSGKSLGRQFYKLAGGARTRIAPKGAARVGYLIDIPCPS